MNDIEQLRQDVIDAALQRARTDRAGGLNSILVEACSELEKAMNPDPWKLLEDVVKERHHPIDGKYFVLTTPIGRAIDALNQHRKNQDGAE